MNLYRRTPKERSRKSERQLASFVGGRVQKASGAVRDRRYKGDVLSDSFLFEDKVTAHKSYGLGRNLIEKHFRESRKLSRRPVIRINFEDVIGGDSKLRVYVLSEMEFAEYMQFLEARSNET